MENTNSVNDSENSASTVFGTDRSWNDPQALFDYKVSSSTTTGTKLNKRIGFPSSTPPSSNVSSMRPESSKLNDAGAKSTTEGKNPGSLVLVMAYTQYKNKKRSKKWSSLGFGILYTVVSYFRGCILYSRFLLFLRVPGLDAQQNLLITIKWSMANM